MAAGSLMIMASVSRRLQSYSRLGRELLAKL